MAGAERGKRPPGPSGRVLIAAVSAGIALLVALVVLLWPEKDPKPSRERRDEQPAAPAKLDFAPEVPLVSPDEVELPVFAEAEADGGAPPAPTPEAETVDLFSGPAPEIIWRGHDLVDKGGRLHSKRVKQVYEYGKEHPEDPRPQIILALDSMNRGWYAFAVGHYKQAVERNPDAAKDPRVMRDLLKIAGNKHNAEKAHAAIVDIYGASALPAVRARIDEAMADGKQSQVTYLEQLAASLEQLEAP